jgi:hypothetical protein
MRAFGLGRTEIAQDLLKAGADPQMADVDGMKAADYARVNGSLALLELIGQKTTASEDNELGD